ncbi:MAG: pyruvate dehydrogenase complex dihydrolipoamide acetyltransferase [Methyloceanibacter sp.]
MPTEILMPALSPTMESGKLAKWLKKEGDDVKSGDVIAEIETDKATMEVEAVDEGKLGKILISEGTEDVAVNTPIAVLLGEGEDAGAIKAEAPKETPKSEAKEEKSEAKTAKAEAPKSPPPPTPPHKGEGSEKAADKSSIAAQKPSPSPRVGEGGVGGQATASKANGSRVFASPLARRLAKEKGLDIAALKGSGPHGRIVAKDVETAKAAPARAPSPLVGEGRGGGLAQPMSDDAIRSLFEEGSYEVVPHDGMRRTVARRLTESKQTIPHFYLTIDCHIDRLLETRQRLNAHAPHDKEKNPLWKLSVNDFIIKAMAMALQKVPDANATWTEGGMLKHKSSDVGVAVAVEGGLFTPIIRKAETKTLSQISNEMKDLAARARKRRLKPEEYQGGTTAISNLGMYGIPNFSAVINPPHATILAVGMGEKRPVVVDDGIEIRTVMSCTLSTDHRAVDGALGAELIGAFKEFVEEPALMLA